jgi:hypothetical protein
MAEKLYKIKELAQLGMLGLKAEAIRKFIRTGELKERNMAAGDKRACWVVSEADLQNFLDDRPTNSLL